MTGALPTGDPNDATTKFSNTNEVAQAGYYSAQSNQPDTITREFTATPHSSMGRFTFPATTQADFMVKLMDSQNGDFGDTAKIVERHRDRRLGHQRPLLRRVQQRRPGAGVHVHFDLVFDHPFTSSQVITQPGQTDPAAVFLTFDTTSNPVIQAKVGDLLRQHRQRQGWTGRPRTPGWDFGSIKAASSRTGTHCSAGSRCPGAASH